MPGSPIDLQAHIRCVGGAVTLTYPAAVYLLALVDVLERLAADRYGCPPREPFGAFREALNAAARELAPASRPVGTCAAASHDEAAPKLVVRAPMSTKEAAELLEITPAGVTHLVRRGRLEATKFGNQWAISTTSVEAYRAGRTPRLKKGEAA
jgi:excisionase family DNA binding protein